MPFLKGEQLVKIARERRFRDLVNPPDLWKGRTVAVIGNGTSLEGVDLSWLQTEHNVICMVANSGMATLPSADVLMCSDRHWLNDHSRDLSAFKGDLIVVTRPEAVHKIDRRMRFTRREYIERVQGDIFADPRVLVEGHTSTATNISLAVLRGAERILLLGLDLRPGKDGTRRARSDVKDDPIAATRRYNQQIRHLTMQSRFVLRRCVVWNCSPRSGLDCYEYADIRNILC